MSPHGYAASVDAMIDVRFVRHWRHTLDIQLDVDHQHGVPPHVSALSPRSKSLDDSTRSEDKDNENERPLIHGDPDSRNNIADRKRMEDVEVIIVIPLHKA